MSSCVSALGPQVTELFYKVMKTVQGKALMEEVDHWGVDLNVYIWVELPVYSLLSDCGGEWASSSTVIPSLL